MLFLFKCEKFPAPPDWICDNLIKHVYINRYVARFDFVGPKTKQLEVVKVRDFIFTIWDIYTSKPTKFIMLNSNLKEFLWYLIKQKNYGYFNFIFNIFQSQLFIFFSIYHKNSFIFVISMVDSVGIDVYMSHIVKMKFLTSTTSSGFVLGPTKSGPATFLFL